ncbi:hypothetical protein D3C76_1690030 [compost metagenome]
MQVAQWLRTAEQVTLNKVAVVLYEKFILLEGFNALGNHFQVQRMGHKDDGPDDLHVLG